MPSSLRIVLSRRLALPVAVAAVAFALGALVQDPPAARAQQERPARPGGGPDPVALRPGYYVVSPLGPDDRGDFGPHTPGTKTAGLQEAFDACKRDKRDLYIVGGAAPAAFQNPGGVYALQATLNIPWMQDFRCDGGEAVLQYTLPAGDAIVMDSQMSCVYKFGLIALAQGDNPDGACLRVKPQTAGPDGLIAVVTSRFSVNALVGAGSRGLEQGEFVARGDGLVLDSAAGGINGNEFFVHEVVGCRRGFYLTAPGPQTAVLNNWIRCPFAHICQTHFQLGDPNDPGGVLWNRIDALVDGDDLKDSTGARIFGRGNRLNLTFLQIPAGRGVVFEAGAGENLVETQNLQARYTDAARAGSNHVRTQEPDGLRVRTPPFPAAGAWVENPYPATVEVSILTPGEVTSWRRRERAAEPLEFRGGVYAGQTFTLRPNESVQFEHAAGAPPATWHWRVPGS
jgi:hypothetical protein